jgi:RNA polymerase-binding transcription factor DksA
MAGMRSVSDDTLRAAREKLLARGALLRDRIKRVQEDLHSARESDAVLQAVEKSANAEISRIALTLESCEDGTFGLCEECGHEIEAARLVAHPYATHCRACARDG